MPLKMATSVFPSTLCCKAWLLIRHEKSHICSFDYCVLSFWENVKGEKYSIGVGTGGQAPALVWKGGGGGGHILSLPIIQFVCIFIF